jgi:hypothetical protein
MSFLEIAYSTAKILFNVFKMTINSCLFTSVLLTLRLHRDHFLRLMCLLLLIQMTWL